MSQAAAAAPAPAAPAPPAPVRRSRFRSARLWVGLLIVLAVVGLAAFGVYRLTGVRAAGDLPVAPARKGEFLVIVRCRGELIARRSVQITAPLNVPNLQIVWLAPPGGQVKEGDPVVRFDPSTAQQQLSEKSAALAQAQATLEQATAQSRITSEQDKRDTSAAKYQVERARLEASKKEIVSDIQGEESRIDLGLSEEKQRVQLAAVKMHESADTAKIASLTRVRDQAQMEVDIVKQRLERMEIKAPLTGVIVYLSNFSQGWANAKPFKVGDNAWPGSAIAEIPDLTTLEMKGKVEEIDRGRIKLGNKVKIVVDSIPEKTFPGELAIISPLTELGFDWPPVRNFRAHATFKETDPRLRPAMNGRMDVVVNQIPDAISVPAKAVFTRNGKPVVYVKGREGYQAVPVEVLARNPDEVAVSGIEAGATVALVDVDAEAPAK